MWYCTVYEYVRLCKYHFNIQYYMYRLAWQPLSKHIKFFSFFSFCIPMYLQCTLQFLVTCSVFRLCHSEWTKTKPFKPEKIHLQYTYIWDKLNWLMEPALDKIADDIFYWNKHQCTYGVLQTLPATKRLFRQKRIEWEVQDSVEFYADLLWTEVHTVNCTTTPLPTNPPASISWYI